MIFYVILAPLISMSSTSWSKNIPAQIPDIDVQKLFDRNVAASHGLLSLGKTGLLSSQDDVARFIGSLTDEAESSENLPVEDDPVQLQPPIRDPSKRASFGLSQGILIPGVKHLMHNAQDETLRNLHNYTWFAEPQLSFLFLLFFLAVNHVGVGVGPIVGALESFGVVSMIIFRFLARCLSTSPVV